MKDIYNKKIAEPKATRSEIRQRSSRANLILYSIISQAARVCCYRAGENLTVKFCHIFYMTIHWIILPVAVNIVNELIAICWRKNGWEVIDIILGDNNAKLEFLNNLCNKIQFFANDNGYSRFNEGEKFGW